MSRERLKTCMKLGITVFPASLTLCLFFCSASRSRWSPECEEGATKILDHLNNPPQQDEALLQFTVFIFCLHTACSSCVSCCLSPSAPLCKVRNGDVLKLPLTLIGEACFISPILSGTRNKELRTDDWTCMRVLKG